MGDGILADDAVRKKMKECYQSEPGPYLDQTAQSLFREGQKSFQQLGLTKKTLVQSGNRLYFFPWVGDKTMETMILLFKMEKVDAYHSGPVLVFDGMSKPEFQRLVGKISRRKDITALELAGYVANKQRNKFDNIAPESLLDLEIAARDINLPGALKALIDT